MVSVYHLLKAQHGLVLISYCNVGRTEVLHYRSSITAASSQQLLEPLSSGYLIEKNCPTFATSIDMQIENTDVGLPTLDATTVAALITGKYGIHATCIWLLEAHVHLFMECHPSRPPGIIYIHAALDQDLSRRNSRSICNGMCRPWSQAATRGPSIE